MLLQDSHGLVKKQKRKEEKREEEKEEQEKLGEIQEKKKENQGSRLANEGL